MKPTLKFCGEQIARFDGMPGYASMGHAGGRERAEALRDESPSEEVARAAMDALISDTCRASSPELNKLPTPGEIRVWVQAEVERLTERFAPPEKPSFCLRCGGAGKVLPDGFWPNFDLPGDEPYDQCEAVKIDCPECRKLEIPLSPHTPHTP